VLTGGECLRLRRTCRCCCLRGGLGDRRVVVATAAFGFLTVIFFGFGALPRAARPPAAHAWPPFR